MNQSPFTIGQVVAFRDRGASREGKVVSTEFVCNGRRRPGWNFLVVCPDGDRFEKHETELMFIAQ